METTKAKPQRVSPGFYRLGTLEISRYTEGPWRGWWMVRDTESRFRYTDPVRTLREAIEDAHSMTQENNP